MLTIDIKETKEKFWELFIIDGLIGNTDRHNGNWGFIKNKKKDKIKFAKIYDCGSCLNPLLEDDEISKLTASDIKNLAINSFSCLKENGKRINYFLYLKKMSNEECKEALKRIFNKINLLSINEFIDSIEQISNTRSEFYKKLIQYRYNLLKEIYNKIPTD